jgi:hypothetical protein
MTPKEIPARLLMAWRDGRFHLALSQAILASSAASLAVITEVPSDEASFGLLVVWSVAVSPSVRN